MTPLVVSNYSGLAKGFVLGIMALFAFMGIAFMASGVFFLAESNLEDALGLVAISSVMLALVAFIYYMSLRSFATFTFDDKGVSVKYYLKSQPPKYFDYNEINQVEVTSFTHRGTTTFYLKFKDKDGAPHKLMMGEYDKLHQIGGVLKQKGLFPQENESFVEERKLEYDPKQRKSSKILEMVMLALLANSCSFMWGGKDWLSDDRTYAYNGSVSYTELPAYVKITGTTDVFSDDKNMHWHYGFSPEGMRKEAKVEFIESSINVERVDRIFFNHSVHSFSPDSIYYVELDVRGNYWTFPFKEKTAFDVYKSLAVQSAQPLEVDESWRTKLNLYSFANHIQITALLIFFSALGYSSAMKEKDGWILFQKSRTAVWVTLGIAASFILASGFKAYVDMPFYTELEWVWLAVVAAICGYFAFRCYEQLRDSKDYVRLTPTHLSFKDNEWEMVVPYNQISELAITNHIDSNGRYSYKGIITFLYHNKKVEMPLGKMNLGECDMEIYESLKKMVGAGS